MREKVRKVTRKAKRGFKRLNPATRNRAKNIKKTNPLRNLINKQLANLTKAGCPKIIIKSLKDQKNIALQIAKNLAEDKSLNSSRKITAPVLAIVSPQILEDRPPIKSLNILQICLWIKKMASINPTGLDHVLKNNSKKIYYIYNVILKATKEISEEERSLTMIEAIAFITHYYSLIPFSSIIYLQSKNEKCYFQKTSDGHINYGPKVKEFKHSLYLTCKNKI